MSRIIVKNLPMSGLNESELRKHFADIDNITDIKLKYNDSGNFRRFAFVGFKSTDAAENAVSKLNNSFIGSSKIAIESCRAIKDIKPEKVTLYKKDRKDLDDDKDLSEGTQAYKGNKKFKSKNDAFEDVQDDPQFKEYVALQRNLKENTQTRQIWADDVRMDPADASAVPSTKQLANKKPDQVDESDNQNKKRHHRSRPKKVSDKSKPKELFVHTMKISGFPSHVRRKDVIDFFKPLKVISVRINKKDEICFASFTDDRDLRLALRKNNQFWTTFRLKMWRHNVKRSRLFKETIEQKVREKQEIIKKQKEVLARTEPIEESGRLFVRNLNYSSTQEDIEEVFSKYGELTEVHYPIDKKTSLPKGYAYVEFMFPQNAKQAYDELNGTIFQGRNFHLIPAEPKPEPRLNAYEQHARRVGSKPDDETKKEPIAAKAEVESEKPARLLPDTKSEQAENASEQGTKMNEATTKKVETSNLSKFKKDKLEKQKETAPRASNWNILFLGQNALADVMSDARGVNKSKLLTQQSRKEPIAVRMALGDATAVEEMRNFLISNGIELDSFDNPKAARSRTVIIVKNLPSSARKGDLLRLFEKSGRVGRIIMPPNGLTAIVEMEEPVEAKLAFKRLAYHKFKDSVLYLEWAPINVFREKSSEDQDQEEIEQLAKVQTGSKLLVKNVPFEATADELKKVFAAHGELNFVRLPKKIDGSHRGFAFVDYLTRDTALRAFRALCHSTHLYGRKLVLEWAKIDDQQ